MSKQKLKPNSNYTKSIKTFIVSYTRWKEESLRVIGYDTAGKVSKYGVFSGPYFPVFGLNTEIYGVKTP